VISGEYSTGMIRASLAVVPARLPMLWAKLAVCAGAVFATMLASSFTAFGIGQAVLSSKNLNASLSDPGALRSIIGAALYLTVGCFASAGDTLPSSALDSTKLPNSIQPIAADK